MAEKAKDPFMVIEPGNITGQTAVPGLRIDFNLGPRVQVPEGEWTVRIVDRETNSLLYNATVGNTSVAVKKHYYVPWFVEVWQGGEKKFSHALSLKGQKVLVKFCSGALGDSLAWVPYVEEFRKKHGCEIWCSMSEAVAELFAPNYPEIHFIGPAERPVAFYASYYMGCFFPSDNRVYQPVSWKHTGLSRCAAAILGLPQEELRPMVMPKEIPPRTIKEPYVCIAAQASSQPKYWNNPEGWMQVVAWLKDKGYRVLCIDRDRCYGADWHKNLIPWGSEDFTGNRPLKERVEVLSHADFFIGTASGLSWLAWCVGIPVVLISGFSTPSMEFATPYRIINFNVCTGCFDDDRYDFEHGRFDWCPRYQEDRAHQFECTRSIGHMQVIQTIERLMRDHGLEPGKEKKEK